MTTRTHRGSIESFDPDLVECLQRLLHSNLDLTRDYVRVATLVDEVSLSDLFHRLASERERQADDLAFMVELGDEAPRDGSRAPARRTWIERAAPTAADTPLELLAEARRRERRLLAAYAAALDGSVSGSPFAAVLRGHQGSVEAAHERLCRLVQAATNAPPPAEISTDPPRRR